MLNIYSMNKNSRNKNLETIIEEIVIQGRRRTYWRFEKSRRNEDGRKSLMPH